ncbi:MAG TPA: IS1595 family transposase [Candidatus Saccharimonadales bacterium]|nr:IS1595 family transposase [Candidatus Saccharimonadales bacterium]
MRYTYKRFAAEFPNDDVCLDAIFQMRYGDVTTCPRCGVIDTKFYRVRGRKCYACKHCGYQLHPLAQTIFHKSDTPLTSWFYVMYQVSVAKNGVSAKEIVRHLGVGYKTAHRMLHKIRSLMQQGGDMLSGIVEIDETYIGGKHKHKYGYSKKQAVFGAVERAGHIKATHVRSTGARVLLPLIEEKITPGAQVYSDEYRAYSTLERRGYPHATVTHSSFEWANGDTHTNTIEGFWGQLKRSISGTYHCVSPQHLQAYVDEFVFRYNFRGVAVYPVLLELAAKPVLTKS